MNSPKPPSGGRSAMHRIREVRETEGISLSAMSRRMNRTVSELKREEQEDCDLRLSDLYRWQSALRVPLKDLLTEPDYGLTEVLRHRACLTRVVKTAKSLVRNSKTPAVRHLAETLVEQLVEIMPELKDQGAWPDRGVQRPANEPGRILEYIVNTDWIGADLEHELS